MEESLLKLSVKELKGIARKNNVNPNLKKVDLVKALLTNLKDIPINVNDEPCGTQTSRRITRSRASIWQHPNEMIDFEKETTEKDKSCFKNTINEKKIKRKMGKPLGNSACETFHMFPLVSTIKLLSKPLIEITNNDVICENVQDKSCTATTTSKRSKRKNVQNNTFEVFPCNNTEANKTSSLVSSDEAGGRDGDIISELNNMPSLGRKRGTSVEKKKESEIKRKNSIKEEYVTKEKFSPSKQSNEQNSTDENCKNINISKENHHDSKLDASRGSKRAKNKSDSLLTKKVSARNTENEQDSCDPLNATNIPNKNKKKKRSKENSVKSANVTQDNCLDENSHDMKVNCPTTSSSFTSLKKDTVELAPSMKSKTQKSPLAENSECDSERRISDTSLIIYDSLKEGSDFPLENYNLSCEELVNSGEQKRGKNKKPIVETCLFEISSNNSSSLQHGEPLDNEYIAENVSVKNSDINIGIKSNTIVNEEDVLTVQGETELKPTQGLIRSSTFILSEPGVSSKASTMPVTAPRRNSTFTIANSSYGNFPRVKSLRFSSAKDYEETATPQSDGKRRQSIGHRIMKVSRKQGGEKESQKSQGSSQKKSSVKSTKMGSICKKSSVTKKMPDFKKIHQQLFHNMESLSEHKKRVQNRALGLLQSPIVPRCAIVSPRQANLMYKKSHHIQAQNTRGKTLKPYSPQAEVRVTAIPSPLAAKLISPIQTRTPAAAWKSASVASSVNRFGFRKLVRKEEATNIIGKRLPPATSGKKKENERNLIKGVRMNKRFMLQMQMRKTGENSDK